MPVVVIRHSVAAKESPIFRKAAKQGMETVPGIDFRKRDILMERA